MLRNNRLLENIASLFLLQGVGYLLPLITVPYLLRVLGPEKFGVIALAQAFVAYFLVLTDYGFNLVATRQVSIHRENQRKVAEIFWVVLFCKLALLLLSLVIMTAFVFGTQGFRLNWPVYYVCFLYVVGSVVFPVWFFQGMEEIKYVSIVSIVSRAIAAIGIFVLVNDEDDYLMAAGLQAGSMILASLLSVHTIRRAVGGNFLIPSLKEMGAAFKEGWHIFSSTGAINLYTSTNVVILGLLTNPVTVGYFSAADKLVRAVQGSLGPISQAIYPHISALAARSKDSALVFIRKSMGVIGVATLMVSFLLFGMAERLVDLLMGPRYQESVILVQLMAFLPFIVGLSNIFGIQTMLNLGLNRLFSRILISTAILSLVIIVPLVLLSGAIGAALALVTTEIAVTISMWLVLKNRGINLFLAKMRDDKG